MDDWAEQQANSVREKRKNEQIEKETRLLEDKQKRAEAPRLWKEFLAGVSSKVDAFNRALKENALEIRSDSDDEVAVGAHGFVSSIHASFNRELLEVRCMVVGTGLDYSIVIRDGQVTLVKGRERSGMVSRAITPENAAQEFVGTITPYV